MQTVVHETEYVHSLMYDIDRLYKDLSEREIDKSLLANHTYDESFKDLVEIFEIYGGCDSTGIKFTDIDYKNIDLPDFDKKNIIVCCSGGKDSLATTLHYIKLGYNVTLFHASNINRGYYGEEQAIRQLADKLNVPLVVDRVSLLGTSCWVESPMKNMIIANLALSYGIRNGITTKIAFGNFTTSSLRDDPFEVCGGDDIEMWVAYEKMIQRIIPKFRMYISLKNANTTYNTLNRHFDLVPYTLSCITPYRFRAQFKERAEKKYGVKLMQNRCGACWKCCVEYIRFTDSDKLELNEEYYMHCFEIFRNTLVKEKGYAPSNAEYIWDSYILYPVEKSKMCDTIKNAYIQSRKIKYV